MEEGPPILLFPSYCGSTVWESSAVTRRTVSTLGAILSPAAATSKTKFWVDDDAWMEPNDSYDTLVNERVSWSWNDDSEYPSRGGDDVDVYEGHEVDF